jgi:hypothetical protein
LGSFKVRIICARDEAALRGSPEYIGERGKSLERIPLRLKRFCFEAQGAVPTSLLRDDRCQA